MTIFAGHTLYDCKIVMRESIIYYLRCRKKLTILSVIFLYKALTRLFLVVEMVMSSYLYANSNRGNPGRRLKIRRDPDVSAPNQ